VEKQCFGSGFTYRIKHFAESRSGSRVLFQTKYFFVTNLQLTTANI
jgi:hypothetical protein